LLRYAFVSQNIFDENDVLFGLLPFFKPIIQEMEGQVFDTVVFSRRVREQYPWPMTSDIAEVLITRFVRAGWLRRIVERQDIIAYQCQSPGLPPNEERLEREVVQRLTEIGARFTNFNQTLPSLLTLSFDDIELQEMLLSWLVEKRAFDRKSIFEAIANTLDTPLSEKVVRIAKSRAGGATRYTQEEEYLCARFVKHLSTIEPSLFESLVKIAAVALVAEVALEISHPTTSDRPKQQLQVFLDAPFAMTLLGLSGHRRRETASYIFERLRELGHAISIFGHSCDEIRANLKGLFDRDPRDRYGPTAEAIRMREVDERYAYAVLANVEHFVEKLGITLLEYDPSLYPGEHIYFPDECVDDLANRLPWDRPLSDGADKSVAKRRDARSICFVMRRRRGRMSADVFRSHVILITQNAALCREATQFLMEKDLLRERQVGPAIHQRYMAANLFLLLGSQEKREMSRRELLASCESIVNASPEVIEGTRKRLLEVRPQNAQQIEALLSQPQSIQLLLDMTLGSQAVLGQADADLIYDTLRQDTAREVRDEAKRQIDSIKRQAKVKEAGLSEKLRHKESELQKREMELREAQQRDLDIVRAWIRGIEHFEQGVRQAEKVVVVVLLVTVMGLSGLLGGNLIPQSWGVLAGLAVAGIPGVITIFQIWDRLYLVSPTRMLQWKTKRLDDAATKLQRRDLLDRYHVDWESRSIQPQTIETAADRTELF
jgi:hypothetical protein